MTGEPSLRVAAPSVITALSMTAAAVAGGVPAGLVVGGGLVVALLIALLVALVARRLAPATGKHAASPRVRTGLGPARKTAR